MINFNGEAYLTVTEVAQRLRVSRATCYNNLLQQMQKCYLPGRKHAMYKQSDIERFAQVRIVEKVFDSTRPASPLLAETRSRGQ